MPIGRALRCHFVLAGEATQSLPRGVIGEAGAPVVLRTSGKAASITAIVLRSDDADSFFRARNHLGMDKRIAVQFGHLLDGFHDLWVTELPPFEFCGELARARTHKSSLIATTRCPICADCVEKLEKRGALKISQM